MHYLANDCKNKNPNTKTWSTVLCQHTFNSRHWKLTLIHCHNFKTLYDLGLIWSHTAFTMMKGFAFTCSWTGQFHEPTNYCKLVCFFGGRALFSLLAHSHIYEHSKILNLTLYEVYQTALCEFITTQIFHTESFLQNFPHGKIMQFTVFKFPFLPPLSFQLFIKTVQFTYFC